MLAWNFGFQMWRLTREPMSSSWGCPVPDLLLCSETLISDRRHISEFLVPGFGRPVLFCRDGMPRALGTAAYVRDGNGGFRNQNSGVAVVRCWYSGCVVLDRTSTCSVCIATLT